MTKNLNAENKNLPEEAPQPQKHNGGRMLKWFLVIVILGTVGTLWWKNPELVSQVKAKLENMFVSPVQEQQAPSQIEILQQEIAQLRVELAQRNIDAQNLSNDTIEKLNQKFENLEKTNLAIIDNKADASTVLGIVTRLDRLENKVNVLARVTDESALILTAVMMVKDSAEQGGSFEYEAAILSQLAQNNVSIYPAVEQIQKIAVNGVKTDVFLVNRFSDIYTEVSELQKKEFEKTWKDRLNSKLNQFIKVRRTNKQVPEFEADKTLLQVNKLVEAGDLQSAVVLLQNPDNANLLAKSEALQEWINWVKTKMEFNAAIKQIANNSLAVMKVKSIKEELSND